MAQGFPASQPSGEPPGREVDMQEVLTQFFTYAGSEPAAQRADALGDLPQCLGALQSLDESRTVTAKRARAMLKLSVAAWSETERRALGRLGNRRAEADKGIDNAKLVLAWVQLHVLAVVRKAWQESLSQPSLADAAQLASNYFHYGSLDGLVCEPNQFPVAKFLLYQDTHSLCVTVMLRLHNVLNSSDRKAAWRATCDALSEVDGIHESVTESQEAKRVVNLARRTVRWLEEVAAGSSQIEQLQSSGFDSSSRTPSGAMISPRKRSVPSSALTAKGSPRAAKRGRVEPSAPLPVSDPIASPAPKSKTPAVEQSVAPEPLPLSSSMNRDSAANGEPPQLASPELPDPANGAQATIVLETKAQRAEVVINEMPSLADGSTHEVMIDANEESPPTISKAAAPIVPDLAMPPKQIGSTEDDGAATAAKKGNAQRRSTGVLNPKRSLFANIFSGWSRSASRREPCTTATPTQLTPATRSSTAGDDGSMERASVPALPPRAQSPRPQSNDLAAAFSYSQGVPIVEVNLEPALASMIRSKAFVPSESRSTSHFTTVEAQALAHAERARADVETMPRSGVATRRDPVKDRKATAGSDQGAAEKFTAPQIYRHAEEVAAAALETSAEFANGATPMSLSSPRSLKSFADLAEASSNGSSQGDEADDVISDSEALLADERDGQWVGSP